MPADIEWRGVCFTDDPTTVPSWIEARPTIDEPPSWWHKIGMLRPSAFEPGERVLFTDLDSIICGDLGDIARYDGEFAMQRDFFNRDSGNSGLMAWEAGSLNRIWTRWDEAGRPSWAKGGDQDWISSQQPGCDYFQDRCPGQIVSFKFDCWLKGRIPDDARVIGFHGRPRPHECRAPYIAELWR